MLDLRGESLIVDCLSGKHLQSYDKTCAPYLRTQMDAVIVAVLQALPILVLQTNSSVDGVVVNSTYTGALGLLQQGCLSLLFVCFNYIYSKAQLTWSCPT